MVRQLPLPSSVLPARRFVRRGFTLVEMLVVLAILGLLVGLTWPSFHRLLNRSRIVDAAKQVRTELGEARLRAIESGKPQVFRFQPGTGAFEIRPKEEETAGPAVLKSALEQLSDEPDDPDTIPGTETDDTAAYDRYLPEGMSFVGQQVAQEPTAQDEEGLVGISTTEMTEQRAWSKPIIFYPNGRTSNARIRVTDGEQYVVDVSLRGLTGTVRVGPALRIELPSETDPLGDSELGLDGELDTGSSQPDTTFRPEGFLGPAPVEAQP